MDITEVWKSCNSINDVLHGGLLHVVVVMAEVGQGEAGRFTQVVFSVSVVEPVITLLECGDVQACLSMNKKIMCCPPKHELRWEVIKVNRFLVNSRHRPFPIDDAVMDVVVLVPVQDFFGSPQFKGGDGAAVEHRLKKPIHCSSWSSNSQVVFRNNDVF